MIDINELRRLAQAAISKMNARDPEFASSVTPLAVLELLDRLEAAEKAVTEAYQRGHATGQEEIEKDLEIERMRLAACGVAALGYFEGCAKEYQSASLTDVIALRKRFEASESDVSAWKGLATQFSQEADALRAKIERMEQQGPVKHEFQGRDGVWYPFIDQRHHENTVADGSWPVRALYALPGAKGE